VLFNSIEYFYFFVVAYLFYWALAKKQLVFQNAFLLVSSYVFYGWWDYRFLGLIFISTVIDFFLAKQIYTIQESQIKKLLLSLSLCVNLGLLAFFKYYNFFIDSWVELLTSVGYEFNSITTLEIILPVGISFYTFQTLSYTIDVYYGRLKPSKSFINFATFVSLFPQLVAGPIERARNLLPQLEQPRTFSKSLLLQGLYLMLWGLFKKIVIADSLAPLTDKVFEDLSLYNGGTLLLGLLYFTFQIYCDFSGYSDIAIGTAKCFGFQFKTNFNFPYFAQNISDFWRRWHMSLSNWFRDYIFIPLGGSKVSTIKFIRNILVVFLVSGLWHGANWTYVFWGLTHALIYFITQYIKLPIHSSGFKNIVTTCFTFIAVMIAWVFFRSPTISFAFEYLTDLVMRFSIPQYPLKGLYYIFILLFFDFCFRTNPQHIFKGFSSFQKQLSIIVFIAFIWVHFSSSPKNFIYFQF